jgi:diphthamide biosynthesis protein 7
VANSTGSFSIYQLKNSLDVVLETASTKHPVIEHFKTIQYFPEDVLITAFSWYPAGWSVGMTLSSGQVCLGHVDLCRDKESASSVEVTIHDLEAWTLAFAFDGSGIFSGGDDSALRYTEVATNQDYHQDFTAVPAYHSVRRMPWTDQRVHGAGVTAILPLSSGDEGSLVLTGSYDDHIRLLQIPAIGRRVVLAESNLGGGVWRLKRFHHPSRSRTLFNEDEEGVLLLASCMHAGARLLRLSQNEERKWQFEVLAKFEEHKSMNYGSDCQSSLDTKSRRTFITTSFYDRLLCLWKY